MCPLLSLPWLTEGGRRPYAPSGTTRRTFPALWQAGFSSDMGNTLRSQADCIISAAISAVMPDAAVIRALEGVSFPGKVILVAAGKAA